MCKEGCEDTEAIIQSELSAGWLVADILLWGLFGLIDLTGGAYNLEPRYLVVDLEPAATSTVTAVDLVGVSPESGPPTLRQRPIRSISSTPVVGAELVLERTADVHSGPSEANDKLGSLVPGRKIKVMESSGKWVRISCDEFSHGWVQSIHLIGSRIESMESQPYPATRETEVTIVRLARVYSGPSSDYIVLDAIPAGSTVAVVEEKDGWYRISSKVFQIGWISMKHTERPDR